METFYVTVIVLAFFLTVIAIVAMVFGRWEVATQVVQGLSGALNKALSLISKKR